MPGIVDRGGTPSLWPPKRESGTVGKDPKKFSVKISRRSFNLFVCSNMVARVQRADRYCTTLIPLRPRDRPRFCHKHEAENQHYGKKAAPL
jgi:hypothetical protein